MIERPSFLATLADAAGDDAALVAQLHQVFLDAARAQLRRMADGLWVDGSQRLAALAATFGADALMTLAIEAEGEPPSEARLRLLGAQLARLETR